MNIPSDPLRKCAACGRWHDEAECPELAKIMEAYTMFNPPTPSGQAETPTPETDKASCSMQIAMTEEWVRAVPADFARSLERRLLALTTERDSLAAELQKLRAGTPKMTGVSPVHRLVRRTIYENPTQTETRRHRGDHS